MAADVVLLLGVEGVVAQGPLVEGRLDDVMLLPGAADQARKLAQVAEIVLAASATVLGGLNSLAHDLGIPTPRRMNPTGPPPSLRERYPTAKSWRVGNWLRRNPPRSGALDWAGAVWIDADLGPDVDSWTEEFDFPVLVVQVDPAVGLASVNVDHVAAFLNAAREAGDVPDAPARGPLPNDKMLLEMGFEFLSLSERRAIADEARTELERRIGDALYPALPSERWDEFDALLVASPEQALVWLAEHDPEWRSSDLLLRTFAQEFSAGRSTEHIEPAYARNRWMQLHAPDASVVVNLEIERVKADLVALRNELRSNDPDR